MLKRLPIAYIQGTLWVTEYSQASTSERLILLSSGHLGVPLAVHNDVLPLIPCQSMLHRRARANLAVEQQAIKSLSQDILKRGVVAFLVENRRSYISRSRA